MFAQWRVVICRLHSVCFFSVGIFLHDSVVCCGNVQASVVHRCVLKVSVIQGCVMMFTMGRGYI